MNNNKKAMSGIGNRLNPLLRASGIVKAHVPAKAIAKYVTSGWRCIQLVAAVEATG
jgi:hypothetical protein